MRALLVLCLLCFGASAQADTWKTLEILVLPGVSYTSPSEQLFGPPPPQPSENTLATLTEQLNQLDLVQPLTIESLVPTDGSSSELMQLRGLAKERFEMGLFAWKALNPQDAITHFERARELHRQAFSDLLAPEELAEVELYRGFALLDLGETGLAHFAFAQSLFYAPEQRFEAGYYGAAVEERLLAAASELKHMNDPFSFRFSSERLGGLGKALKQDYLLVHLTLMPSQERLVQVGLFDVRTSSFSFRIQLPVDSSEGLLQPTLSAWHACALEVSRTLIRKRTSRLGGLELGYAHHLWLHHRPTRNFLHGPGVELALNYQLNSNLELWAAYRQRVTLLDANTDLLDVFTSGHLSAGLGLILGSERLRASIRLGFEFALTHSDITATTDVDCKFFGPTHPRCRGVFRADNPAFLGGIEVGLRVRYMPARTWYLTTDIGLNSYLFSQSLTPDFNFPLHGSLKLGIPF